MIAIKSGQIIVTMATQEKGTCAYLQVKFAFLTPHRSLRKGEVIKTSAKIKLIGKHRTQCVINTFADLEWFPVIAAYGRWENVA